MDSLVILGIEYGLEFVDYVSKEELRKGEIDFLNGTIKIDRTMSEDIQKQTIIHEILHGICESLGYGELNNDEEKIQGLATALYQVFSSQQNLTSFCFAKESEKEHCRQQS